MNKRNLTATQEASAKLLAIEVVVLTLLRERAQDHRFTSGLDELMQRVLALHGLGEHPNPQIRATADAAQDFLDSWLAAARNLPDLPAA